MSPTRRQRGEDSVSEDTLRYTTKGETMNDRTVHAWCDDGREIVRYERAGKWYIEPIGGKRRQVSLREAVEVAVRAHLDAGRGLIVFGRPGGVAFDRQAAKRLAEARRAA